MPIIACAWVWRAKAKASRVVPSQDQCWLQGPGRSTARAASQELWCIFGMPRIGLLGHTGLKVNQRTPRALSGAVFYAIGVSGMTKEEMCPENENSHLQRGLVCQEYHRKVCVGCPQNREWHPYRMLVTPLAGVSTKRGHSILQPHCDSDSLTCDSVSRVA